MLNETEKPAHYEKRFGIIAIEKGFITQEDLNLALTTQVREDIEHGAHRLIGELFFDLNIMDENQLDEVFNDIIHG